MTLRPKIGRGMLWWLPVVLIPAAFFAGLPWLKTISQPAALLITAAVMISVMAYGNYLSFRALRGLDEVHRAGAAFAAQWGAPAGQVVFALLLVLTPFRGLVGAFVNRFAANPGTAADEAVIAVTLSVGFCALLLCQAVGMVVVQALWWTAKR